MAIFGTLTEIPLPELLRTLERRTGKLTIEVLPQKCAYDLYLEKAKLKAMLIDGKALQNRMLIREAVSELSKAKEGDYTFKAVSRDVLPQNFDVAIEPLLLTNDGKDDREEINRYRNRLPAAQTRFKSSSWGKIDTWPSSALQSFWEKTHTLFSKGTSAEEITKNLGLDIEKTQLYIYKLRSLGQISPIRSFGRGSANSLPQKTTAKKPNDIESFFVKNIANLSYEEILKNLQSAQSPPNEKAKPQPREEKLNPIFPSKQMEKPNQPSKTGSTYDKGLISNLLKALKQK